MNPYIAARHQPARPAPMSRIDLLLAMYDGAIERLQTARGLLKAGNAAAARPLVARVQLIVSEMAAGVRLEVNEDMGTNYLRLYEFVVDRLTGMTDIHMADALKILVTLRGGFAGVRDEAVAMERRGEFTSSDRLMTLCETA